MHLTKSALWVLAGVMGGTGGTRSFLHVAPGLCRERQQCLKSKFGELGGKCQWRALALLTAFQGIHSTIAHHASASCCVELVHLCSLPLHEMKGSKVESGKSRKLGLPLPPSVWKGLWDPVCHFFIASFQLSAVCLNPRRESAAQPSRLLITLFSELPSTQFSISMAYYGGLICTAPLSCHLQSSAFPTMGSCLGSLSHEAPWFCLVLLRGGTKSMKLFADLAGDLWSESLNT